MFRRKTAKEAPSQPTAQAAPTYSGGYQSVELPTFHGRKRKVVVYTSDASGKIIKTIKR
jgi:queuine/archaeosine tRNA-ribosyltransferase